jgi:hypothetical protein
MAHQDQGEHADPFDAWLEQMSYLSPRELSGLPGWQRPLAVVHQFAVDALTDGAGSLFYNNPDDVDPLVSALEALGEQELAEKIRAISRMLEALDLGDVTEYAMRSAVVEELDALLNRRWNTIYTKIEERARANGWNP